MKTETVAKFKKDTEIKIRFLNIGDKKDILDIPAVLHSKAILKVTQIKPIRTETLKSGEYLLRDFIKFEGHIQGFS